jgi:hypothetical protein
VFFIPIVYLLILLIWGIIYSASRDQSEFKLITQYEESVNPQENVMTLNSIIFYKKMIYQTDMKSLGFCQVYEHFILMMHPLARLKFRLDMSLPRVYHFLTLFTRLMIIFGLCFYFLRKYSYEALQNSKLEAIKADLLMIGVGCIVCSCVLIPLPSFLYACCKSRYYLLQQEKDNEPGELSVNNSASQK